MTPGGAGFSWSAIVQGLPYLLQGAGLTLVISAAAMVLAVALGLALAALSQAPGRLVHRLVAAYVEIFRNTPLLIQIFIVYFGLPQLGVASGACATRPPRCTSRRRSWPVARRSCSRLGAENVSVI